MNRRQLIKTMGMSAVALGVRNASAWTRKQSPQISITMDDFSWARAIRLSAEERNEAILKTLRAHNIKAGLFVVGRNADSEQGKALLSAWDKAGHLIGNHTYSHRNYNGTALTVAQYQDDILRAESVLKEFPHFQKYFRFPMLKEGNTAEKRDAMRTFLEQHGYRTGHVTVDNSDWIVDQRLNARLQKDPAANVNPYRDFYLEHMWDRAQYYDSLARKVLGRPVKHTLLMHFNLLNGLFLGNLLQIFKSKGWRLIDAEEAFTDPVFSARPKIVPAGESIIWSLAKESGKIDRNLRYPAEDGDYETARMNKLRL